MSPENILLLRGTYWWRLFKIFWSLEWQSNYYMWGFVFLWHEVGSKIKGSRVLM
jgi:hypothetical protein